MRSMRLMVAALAAVAMVFGFAVAGFAAGQSEGDYVAVISKGEQHDFWQNVRAGAEDAAEEFDVEMTYEGPASEEDVQDQVQMLNSAMARNPSAVALAALDTEAVMDKLQEAMAQDIPVVGFDSGVPNAPEGAIVANAATNNYEAAGMAADEMFEALRGRIEDASSDEPVTIAVLNQDSAAESLLSRGTGFRDRMIELIDSETDHSADDISVTGNQAYIDDDTPTDGDIVTIDMVVPASASTTDISSTASNVFRNVEDDNIIGIFASNEGTVGGVLSATDDGSALGSEFEEVTVVGFDAGSAQKDAVRQGYFLGSITQDPYMIGYEAVRLAVDAIAGKDVEDVDTGAIFWDSENMDDPEIAELLYD